MADKLTDASRAKPNRAVRTIPARHLFNDDKEVVITYRGESYRLRITRNDKLILTK